MRILGVYNANEIRALEDMPSIEGGNSYYASLNYVPQDIWPVLSLIRALGAGVDAGPLEGETE